MKSHSKSNGDSVARQTNQLIEYDYLEFGCANCAECFHRFMSTICVRSDKNGSSAVGIFFIGAVKIKYFVHSTNHMPEQRRLKLTELPQKSQSRRQTILKRLAVNHCALGLQQEFPVCCMIM